MKTPSLVIRICILLLVFIVCSIGTYVWWNDAVSPMNAENPNVVQFVISKNESIRTITNRLAEQDLIRSSIAFYILVKLLGIETKIQAGDFRLSQSMDAETVATALTKGSSDIWITTIEGWRVEEIASKLSHDLEIPESEFLKYAEEGYMFPDTYLIPKTASAAAIAKIFKDTFDMKISKEMREEGLKTGLTFPELVVLASIVEREGKNRDDKPIIAGILLNRLKMKMPLQVDATLQYASGYQSSERSWWKKTLYNEDKTIQSPYNTYSNVGLPPNPISNPGYDSLYAVIHPSVTDYLYYLHSPDGLVHYAKTLEEHSSNIEKYLR